MTVIKHRQCCSKRRFETRQEDGEKEQNGASSIIEHESVVRQSRKSHKEMVRSLIKKYQIWTWREKTSCHSYVERGHDTRVATRPRMIGWSSVTRSEFKSRIVHFRIPHVTRIRRVNLPRSKIFTSDLRFLLSLARILSTSFDCFFSGSESLEHKLPIVTLQLV